MVVRLFDCSFFFYWRDIWRQQNENGVADTFGDEDSEDDEDQGDAVEVDSSAAHLGYWRRNPSLGSSKANNHGGSQIDHDDDDDVVRVGSGGTAAAQGLAGKPPLGLKANSLASMIVGSETPTCQLQDHPIQVRMLKEISLSPPTGRIRIRVHEAFALRK